MPDPRLDARDRIGVYARRRARAQLTAWLRERWIAVVSVLGVGLAFAAGAHIFVPSPLNAYLSSAILTSALWWTWSLTVDAAGVRHLHAGIAAEEWTSDELRRLKAHGWRVINHVRLEVPDVDHVILGPGGWFAVETKYRRDWSLAAHDLRGIADDARYRADQVRLRIDPKGRKVEAVVVLWGPNAAAIAADANHRGITFCAGKDLRALLRAQPAVASPTEVDLAFGLLAGYVERRDRGEAAREGERPRLFEAGLTDLLLAIICAVAVAVGILSAASLNSSGWLSVVLAALIAATSAVVRRTTRSSIRSQRVTVAVLTMSAGLGGLLLTVATWSALAPSG